MRDAEKQPFDKDFLKQAAKKAGFDLTDGQTVAFEKYYDLLIDYNRKVNLTAVTDPEGVAVRHFVDSLTLLYAPVAEGARIADIGAGAGFPSVPVSIVRGDVKLTLIDGLNKRITFLHELSQKIGISFEAIHARAEEAGRDSRLREKFDVVCARGVAKLYLLCEYCLPFVKKGGIFVAMKGPEPQNEADEAKKAIAELGGKLSETKTFSLPDLSGRSIIIIKKMSTTSAKYPRTSSKISKYPLI